MTLRAKGETFDAIAKEIRVSKPTLIKWNKEYSKEIGKIRNAFLEDIVTELFKEERELILTQIRKMKKELLKDITGKKVKPEMKNIIKQLDRNLRINIKKMKIEFHINGEIDRIEITCK